MNLRVYESKTRLYGSELSDHRFCHPLSAGHIPDSESHLRQNDLEKDQYPVRSDPGRTRTDSGNQSLFRHYLPGGRRSARGRSTGGRFAGRKTNGTDERTDGSGNGSPYPGRFPTRVIRRGAARRQRGGATSRTGRRTDRIPRRFRNGRPVDAPFLRRSVEKRGQTPGTDRGAGRFVHRRRYHHGRHPGTTARSVRRRGRRIRAVFVADRPVPGNGAPHVRRLDDAGRKKRPAGPRRVPR